MTGLSVRHGEWKRAGKESDVRLTRAWGHQGHQGNARR
jgi:hypothetical protein